MPVGVWEGCGVARRDANTDSRNDTVLPLVGMSVQAGIRNRNWRPAEARQAEVSSVLHSSSQAPWGPLSALLL